MWMMGYNDGHDLNMPDSFNGRKLRPLMPRPVSSTNNPSTTTPPCLGRIHGTDFFTLNQHLGSHFVDQNKREFNTAPVVVSSRWNPTPEQLRTLEELYRCGTRTPSADQIQHITAQLRRYGKIEGKNVFYWFQNHKARERQKRRRQMESTPDHHEHVHEVEIMERKDTGGNRTGYEVEQTKNWATSTNCSTLAEESRAAKVALAERRQSSGGSGGWIQFDEEELHHRRLSFTERNATRQMVQLSCPSPTHLINTTCTTTNITTRTNPSIAAKAPSPTPPPATALTTIMDQKQLIKAMTTHDHHHHHLNIFIPPGCSKDNVVNNEILDDGCGESHHTLQLFPLRSGDGIQNNLDKATDVSVTDIDASLTPYQFFEFLPLKN